jgi:glycosyltransferase involved in cell wall biosynthesis
MSAAVKIGVYGMEEAPGFLAGELRDIGLDARELPDLAPGTLVGLDLLHVFYPPMAWRGLVTARLMGLATVAHWMGSDVPAVRRGRQRLKLRLCSSFIQLHLADSAGLVGELAGLGVRAHFQPVLSDKLAVEDAPWPEERAVLVYIPPERGDFYGVPRAVRLARRMPDARFRSCGPGPAPADAPPNWEHLGVRDDMSVVYAGVRVLLRPTAHDGQGRMVLEALARGRRVVWSGRLPHVLTARADDELERAVREALDAGPNRGGREMVRRFFDRRRSAFRLRDYYRLLVGRMP